MVVAREGENDEAAREALLRPQHVFFSGGGLKVVSFIGAMSLVNCAQVETWSGVSAGGLLALLFSIARDAVRVHDLVRGMNLGGFLHAHFSVRRARAAGTFLNHDEAERCVESALAQLGVPVGATFAWHEQHCAARVEIMTLDAARAELTPLGNATPDAMRDVPLARAAVAGMSLPFLFPPCPLQRRGRLLLDAALVNNAPLEWPLRRRGRLLALVMEEREILSRSQALALQLGGRFGGVAARCILAMRASVHEARRRGAAVLELLPSQGAHLLCSGAWHQSLILGRITFLCRLLRFEILGLLVHALLTLSALSCAAASN